MIPRIKNIILTYGLDMAFVMLLTGMAVFLFTISGGGIYIFVFFFFLILSLLSILNYLHDVIDSRISPVHYNDLYSQTVESILTMESFNEMLKIQFDSILNLISVKSGLLIFYYPDREEFNIFYQKDRKKRVIRNANVEINNILLRSFASSEDVIVRSKLNPYSYEAASLIREIDRLNGEVILPIYFHDTFLGLIVIGRRKRRLSGKEIRLLKIFASKIAILSINSFYFNEILKKKELEKEFELASRIHRRFMPDPDLQIGRLQIRVHHQTTSLMTREFYDVFINDAREDDVRISAYRIQGNIAGISIYMPGIQALLQSYSRLGMSPSRVIRKVSDFIRERNLLDEKITLFHSSFEQSGIFEYCNSGYPDPFLYRSASQSLEILKQTRKGAASKVRLEEGDTLLVSCEPYHGVIRQNGEKFTEFLQSSARLPLAKIRPQLLKMLAPELDPDESTDRDKLLILVRMKEVS